MPLRVKGEKVHRLHRVTNLCLLTRMHRNNRGDYSAVYNILRIGAQTPGFQRLILIGQHYMTLPICCILAGSYNHVVSAMMSRE